MDAFSPACRCVTITLPRGVSLSPGGLRLLLRYTQRRIGAEAWGGAVAEEFRAGRGTLLIARPALSAGLAEYALPFLRKFNKLDFFSRTDVV